MVAADDSCQLLDGGMKTLEGEKHVGVRMPTAQQVDLPLRELEMS